MKKAVAFGLTVAMMASIFAGCSSSNQGDSTTIKLGGSGPLTGTTAVYGNAVQHGMEIAIEELNAKGGLQMELNFQDDEGDSEKAVNAYNTLKDWGMQVMVGPTTTGSANTVAAECASDSMFMLTPSASGADVIKAGDSIFQVCFSDPNQGVASADYFAAHTPDAVIGVIYDSSDLYSAGVYSTFAAEAKAKGLNVVCAEAFTADNKADLSTQITKCQSAGADLVFLPFYATEAAQVLTYADKIGYKPTFFGCDGMDGILATEGFDPKLAEGLMLLTPFAADAEDENTQNFVKKYQEKYNGIPNQFAADAYDAVYAVYQACTEAGVTPDMSAEEINEKLVAQFTSMTFDGLTGAGMTWDASGAVSKVPMAVVIENGVYVSAEKD